MQAEGGGGECRGMIRPECNPVKARFNHTVLTLGDLCCEVRPQHVTLIAAGRGDLMLELWSNVLAFRVREMNDFYAVVLAGERHK